MRRPAKAHPLPGAALPQRALAERTAHPPTEGGSQHRLGLGWGGGGNRPSTMAVTATPFPTDDTSSGPSTSSSESGYDDSPLPPRAKLPRSAQKPPHPPDTAVSDSDDELPPRTTHRVPAVMCGGPLVPVPGSTGIWGPPGTPLPYGCEAWDPSVVPSARLGVG